MLLAVIIIQLQQRLALGSIVGTDAGSGPFADDMVAFGTELF